MNATIRRVPQALFAAGVTFRFLKTRQSRIYLSKSGTIRRWTHDGETTPLRATHTAAVGIVGGRRFSGSRLGTNVEVSGVSEIPRLKSKRGEGAAVTAAFNHDDLEDLNSEIAGFVGSLGDPDFDLQENMPTSPPAPDGRPSAQDFGMPTSSAMTQGVGKATDQWTESSGREVAHHSSSSSSSSSSDAGSMRGESVLAPNRQTRRLTLADHPVALRDAGAVEAAAEEVEARKPQKTGTGEGLSQPASSWLEEIQARSAPLDRPFGGTTQEEANAAAAAASAAAAAVMSFGNPGSSSCGPIKKSSFAVHQGSREAKSVLVLNGAACFIGGRLASTGEPQESITRALEGTAAELGLSLKVCTSNREDELLDQLCGETYDAIIYNPSGFTSHGVSGPDRSATGPRHGAGFSQREAPQDPPAAGEAHTRGLEHESALEYGLSRAGCPVVVIAPRKVTGRAPTSRRSSVDAPRGGRTCDEAAGSISGFSGGISYRLAMIAVADMLACGR